MQSGERDEPSNPDDAVTAGAEIADRVAGQLSAVTLDRLQSDFPDWSIWYSQRTGNYHARRADLSGRFTENETDPRRFHVSAETRGRLAVLLILQVALDEL